MLFDVDDLQSYMSCAVDHFATTLEEPFDFVRASVFNSPIPSNFAGNILKLAINIMQNFREETVDVQRLFGWLALMVASCIMLDVIRNKKGGIDFVSRNQKQS